MPRNIPEEIKREVRQRSGFGCVICGDLPYDYEHITPYAECQRHEAANIVLLCPTHHREVTSGRMSKGRVISAQADPFSLRSNESPFYKFCLERQRRFIVGSNTVNLDRCHRYDVLMIRNRPVLSFEFDEDAPLLSLHLQDGHNDLVRVVRNELIVSPGNVWDLRLEGPALTVHRGAGDVALRIIIREGILQIDRLNFVSSGISFNIEGQAIAYRSLFGDPPFAGLVSNGHHTPGRRGILLHVFDAEEDVDDEFDGARFEFGYSGIAGR